MARRRFEPLTVFGIPLEGGGVIQPAAGPELWVNPTTEVRGRGTSWDRPLRSVEEAFDKIGEMGLSNGILYLGGDIREEVVAPLGIYGWKMVGAAGGRPRHVTADGVALVGNGVNWREPASGATSGGALLTLIEHGWELHGVMMIPKSDGTALRLRRAEDGTYPDPSHALISRCRFFAGSAATTKGIEDHGGCSQVTIRRSVFDGLADAIDHTTGAGIDAPNLWVVEDNYFLRNTNHLDLPCDQSLIRRNVFDEATLNIDTSGGLEGGNFVIENQFANAEADITNSDGYTGHASDVWRNWAADGDTMIAGVPGA